MARRKLLMLFKPFDAYPVLESGSLSRITNPQELQMLRYLESRCKVHKNAINFCQDILRSKPVEWEAISRNNLSQPIRDVDLVVTVGGDGTLLQASHFMDDSVPVLGVNSDPTQVKEVEEFNNEFDATRSTGYLCTATINNFEQVLDNVIEGRMLPSKLSRISVLVNSQLLPTFALNDILIAHPCPAAVSRFSFREDFSTLPLHICFKFHCFNFSPTKQINNRPKFFFLSCRIKRNDQSFSPFVHCRSSGFRVSTAAGSTAAMLSAGGFPMPPLSRELQYMVREPISPGAAASLMHGFTKPNESMDFTWFSKEGDLYIDGSHVCYSIKYGDTIQISSQAPVLKVFLSQNLLSKNVT